MTNRDQQTRYFHGVIVPAFARRFHMSAMAARGLLLKKFVPIDVVDFEGFPTTIPVSWSALSVGERSRVIDAALHLAAAHGMAIEPVTVDLHGV